MLYFVSARYIDLDASIPPKQLAEIAEQMVIPSLEAISRLEREGKILAGGMHTGGRSASFIIKADSHEEVSDILRSLPFWIMIDWSLVPLESFAHRTEQEIKRLKGFIESAS